ncbi:hypothetical protein PHSY_001449 [Pseudozyma hubeiensis SY62]|uniref:DUF3752 domain-containing protein n=1 Tax=Pseudozyma hubeiensis (strain SY62) TaxID=1305764 RepID=R9NZ01_PSEHS|nr:hypothetical protein PHSY_001449 [Pseudozyma hubeiensis SY62]GAC93882.1 hypothetical protein PHSY_001449 [Pseudozyma hubeiensis SY62]
MATIGPQLPASAPRRSRSGSDSESSRSSFASSSSSRSASPSRSDASSRQQPRCAVAGPHLPSNFTRSRTRSPSAAPSETVSSDDEAGPSVGPTLPTHASSSQNNGLSEGARLFLEREARKQAAEDEAKLAAEKAANSRPEWMLLPPSLSNASSLQAVAGDPLNLKSRGFAQTTPRVSARGGGAAAEDADTSVWTETPEERLKRMQDEVSGVKGKTATGLSDKERLKRERQTRRDRDIAKAVADGRSGKKSLVEEHNERRRRELRDKREDDAREERRREKRRKRDDDDDRGEKGASRHSRNDDRDRRRRHRSRSRSRSRSPDARHKAKDRHERGHRHRSSRQDDPHRSHGSSRHKRSDASDDEEEQRRRERRKRKDPHRSRDKDRDGRKESDRDREKERKSHKSRKQREEEDVRSGKAAAPMIWDRDAALSVGGRLMDEAKRGKMMADANSLGDRFGSGSRRFL